MRAQPLVYAHKRSFGGTPGILTLVALAWPLISFTGSSTARPQENLPTVASDTASPRSDSSHCLAISAGGVQNRLLTGLCEFPMTYLGDLPDFICEQTTTNTGPQQTIVLKAQVTFEKGQERYSIVTINGKPLKIDSSAACRAMRFVSMGELGSDLVDLFKPPIVAEFEFRKEGKFRHTPVSVYEFHIAADKNTFWALRDDTGVTLYPEYEGELWLDSQKGNCFD